MKTAIFSVNVSRDDKRLKMLTDSLEANGAEVVWVDGKSSLDDVDLALSIGGDGTFLRLITMMGGLQVPVAGINFGHLGFLTTARVEETGNAWIEDLVKGNYSIDRRMLLKSSSDLIPQGFFPFALNEFAIHNKGTAMLRIGISINNLTLPAYWADGVIISTPTGSTAYSLSAGGPIVTPDSDVLIICPVAPHNLNVRPIVAPADSIIRISYKAKREDALITLDNRSFGAPPAGEFRITKADFYANSIRLHNINFIDALRDKLLWGEDRRNTL